MAELDEFALHSLVSPRRVTRGHADHERTDRRRRGQPPGTPPDRVNPVLHAMRSCLELLLRLVGWHATPGVALHKRRLYGS
jgi:hypothetical protein